MFPPFNVKVSPPSTDINEVIVIIVGEGQGVNGAAYNANTAPNAIGNFVKTGTIQNQADYPELYARLGLIDTIDGNTPYYNVATQFYVPKVTITEGVNYYQPNFRTNYSKTAFITYIRAK